MKNKIMVFLISIILIAMPAFATLYTFNEGDSMKLVGAGSYEGDGLKFVLKSVAQYGTDISTYKATFELYEYEQENDDLIDSITAVVGDELNELFTDGSGNLVLKSSVIVKTIAVGATTGVPYVELEIDLDPFVCRDSDGGKNYYKKGTTKTKTEEYTDQCWASSNTTDKKMKQYVKEYYCVENSTSEDTISIGSTDFECINGCDDGRCITENKCEDTDKGRDYFTKGMVKSDEEEYSDACWNYSSNNYGDCQGTDSECVLVEMSCRDKWDSEYGWLLKEKYSCPNGCYNGACARTYQEEPVQNSKCTCTNEINELKKEIDYLKQRIKWFEKMFESQGLILEEYNSEETTNYEDDLTKAEYVYPSTKMSAAVQRAVTKKIDSEKYRKAKEITVTPTTRNTGETDYSVAVTTANETPIINWIIPEVTETVIVTSEEIETENQLIQVN
ncbi:MAG: hypothetical protein JW703_04750 [Candidatus Diapherotrites archaeon]|nr:hypothetical protein [Candidatus Diapherotrites archaeon]